MAKDCPVCGKTATRPHLPFCSKRCADLDLSNWFKGSYAVPVAEQDDVPEDEDIEDAPEPKQ